MKMTLKLPETSKRIAADKAANSASLVMIATQDEEDKAVKKWIKTENVRVKATLKTLAKFAVYEVYASDQSWTKGEVYVFYKLKGVTPSWFIGKKIEYPKGYQSYGNTFIHKKDALAAVKYIEKELAKPKPKKDCDAFKTDLSKLMKKYGVASL